MEEQMVSYEVSVRDEVGKTLFCYPHTKLSEASAEYRRLKGLSSRLEVVFKLVASTK
jgi:5-methylcytosine-specific restriction endonuclease McrBC regulatory subunit McrC